MYGSLSKIFLVLVVILSWTLRAPDASAWPEGLLSHFFRKLARFFFLRRREARFAPCQRAFKTLFVVIFFTPAGLHAHRPE